jgi:hypothetical protein
LSRVHLCEDAFEPDFLGLRIGRLPGDLADQFFTMIAKFILRLSLVHQAT